MKAPKRLLWLLTLGVVLLVGAGAYRKQMRRPPRSAATAAAELRVREMEKREAVLRAGVDAAPKDVNRRWALADFYRQTGQLEAMAGQLEAVIGLEPQNVTARLALAKARLALQQSKQAERDYRDLTEHRPKLAEAWQGLAAALYRQERYLEAGQAAQRAVNLDAKDPNNRYMLAIAAVEYVMQFPELGGHDETLYKAKAQLERLVKTWPERGDVYYRLGRACVGLREVDAAAKNLQRAVALSPERLDIRWELIRSHVRAGDRSAARAATEEALAHFPEDATLRDLQGQLIQAGGAPDADQKALESFQKAVRLNPNRAAFWENLGGACLRLNQLEEARGAFERAARLSPNRAFPHQKLAVIYTRENKPEQARRAARIAAQRDLQTQQLRLLVKQVGTYPHRLPLRLALADRYRNAGQLDAARDEYLLALEQEPANARARSGLGAVLKAKR